MHRHYWESVARHYDHEIFDVFAHDRRGLVRSHLDAIAHPQRNAADFGCGVGRWLPLLSERFGQVTAVDLSQRCLDRARLECRHLTNVEYHRLDLTHPRTRLPLVDAILCVNAILMPSVSKRLALFQRLESLLNVGGRVVLVVPSLESALLTHHRLVEWNLQDGQHATVAHRASLRRWRGSAKDIVHGIVSIDRVRTKHYLREELEVLLRWCGLEVIETAKLEYGWTSEFQQPPSWMRAPYPWDWVVVARKPARRTITGCARPKSRYP